MTPKIAGYLRAILAAALAMGITLSANARSAPHELTAPVKIVADHQAQIGEHGHAHEDLVDLMHAWHGHGPEIADHDHTLAVLPTREGMAAPLPTSTGWAMAEHDMPDRREHGPDRPPPL